jgi:hypothetical protein
MPPVVVRRAKPDPQRVQYPPNHKPGMEVPKGGSSCASCEYLNSDKKTCSSQYFIKWNGSERIPMPDGDPTRYCSDFYEPRK